MLPELEAVVSVELQLSCSVVSIGPAAAPSVRAVLLEVGVAALLTCSDGVSDSEVFVHCRAFFYRSLKKVKGKSII